jgi:membrane associated rhomboid family serine protease
MIGGGDRNTFYNIIASNVGLPPINIFGSKFWTIFTYGWIHNGFWELFSNMIWLYCFGSIVQMLVGYRQIIPMFFYAVITGGLFYYLGQLIPAARVSTNLMLGAQAGVVAIAVASLTLAPNYRIYFAPTFSIPLVIVAVVFFALMVMNSNLELPRLSILAGGALTGFFYVKALHNGYKPADWIYRIFTKVESVATPNEFGNRKTVRRNEVLSNVHKGAHALKQKRIDDILDKINQHGYNSLTKEEKEILMKASQEND